MNGYWNRMKVAKSFAALKKTLVYPTLMHSRGAAVLAERQRTGASVHLSGSNLIQNTSPQREAAHAMSRKRSHRSQFASPKHPVFM